MENLIPKTVKHAIIGQQSLKHDQLQANTVEPTHKTPMSTDWGVKQSNDDSWLRINNENQTGPMLLEDGIARQKVRKNSGSPGLKG